jgi:zinc protease
VKPLLTFDPELEYDRCQLDNGLTILCVENHEVPFVSVRLGLEAGAWTDDHPGTASLALGMLTKGTARHNAAELADELDTHAISLSGSAEMDTSSVNLSCLTGELATGIQLLADVVLTPTMSADEFRKLKEQVRTGLAISSREPSYLADRELRQQLYGNHPYARSVVGELEDLDQIEVAKVQAWWKLHARPEQATLIFAGDVTLKQAEALAQQTLGGWKSEGPSTLEPPAAPMPADATRIVLVDHPGVQAEIRVGQMGIAHKDPDYFVGRLVSSYFGGAFSSRLNETIRVQKGLTYGARGGFIASRFCGEFRASTFSKNASAVETVRTILDEIDRLRSEPPTEEELEKNKSYFVGSFPSTRETPQQVAGELWQQAYLDLPADFSGQLLREVSAATAESCQNVAQRRVDPSRLVIVVVGPARTLKESLEAIAPVRFAK